MQSLPPPPRRASHFRSNDLDEIYGFVARGSGHHTRVAHRAGAVGFEQAWVTGDAATAGWIRMGIGVTICGSLPGPVLHLGQPAGAEYRFGRSRYLVNPGTVMLVPPLWEYTLKRPAGAGFALAVSLARLAEEIEARDPSGGRELVLRARAIALAQPASSRLATAIADYVRAFEGEVTPASLAGLESQLIGTLAGLLIDESFAGRGTDVSAARLAEVEAWIEANLQAPISAGRLCAVACVGERALQKNFLSRRGMSPMRFVIERRLAAARRQLSAGDRRDSVTQIALSLGFTHTGRFAILYRSTFGESPAETLRRARG